jgi:hypothetical protein
MLKALVIKELRESAGLVALAALGLVYAYTEATGMRVLPWQSNTIYHYPFVYDSTGTNLSMFVGGLAIALGLKQTAWEGRQGTFFFLLHRPVSRARIFLSKLAVGLIWVLATSAIFILLYAWWAATPGHVAAPFEWSMTKPAWQVWASLPVLYFGGFLSGIRPARWWGTRLVPVAAAIIAAVVASNMPWFRLTVVLSIVFSALTIIGIFYYVRARDY